MDVLSILALCMLFIIGITLVYVVIYIHDIPYEIAKKRNHPHRDAIHMAGWVSLILMHSIWPLLWIWAYLYREDNTSLIKDSRDYNEIKDEISALKKEIETLKTK